MTTEIPISGDPARASEDLSQWTAVIVPERGLLDMRLRELWDYRELIYLFLHRDFLTSTKQTVLGPFWFFAQPLLTSIVFTIIFGRINKVVTPGTPQILFFMAGVTLWTYFSNCLLKTSSTLIQNSQLFGKVYFPRLAVPVSAVLMNLIIFVVQFAFFLALFLVSAWLGVAVHPNWRIVTLPLLLLNMGMLGLGVGCIVAALTTRYRDLAMAVTLGVQLWMFASCVMYPLSAVPPDWRWVAVLNPIVPVIEAFRFAFLGVGIVEWWHLIVSFAISAATLVIGLILFNKVESTFLDVV